MDTRMAVVALPLGLLGLLGLLGCGGDETPSGGDISSGGGAPASCQPAQEPFGTDPAAGHFFPDMKLTACDGTRTTLDQLRCEHEITLLNVGAGWCEPCKAETPELQEAFDHFADRGLGIVQVMFQDGAGLPATTAFCQQWTEQFALTMPVFVDPAANTLDYFELAQTPLNLFMTREGRVLWSATGKPDDLFALIEQQLP